MKRPDPPPDIVLPKPATTVPTKPEVYFIRYKTQVCIQILYYHRDLCYFNEEKKNRILMLKISKLKEREVDQFFSREKK